jgi:hypothetical protein
MRCDDALRLRLASDRFGAKVMNKFRANIPEASRPKRIAVVCRGRILDSLPSSVRPC